MDRVICLFLYSNVRRILSKDDLESHKMHRSRHPQSERISRRGMSGQVLSPLAWVRVSRENFLDIIMTVVLVVESC